MVPLPAPIVELLASVKLFAFRSIALLVELIATAAALVILPVPAVERATPPFPVIAPPNVMLLLSLANVREPTVVDAFSVTAPVLLTLALPEVIVLRLKVEVAVFSVPAPPMLPLVDCNVSELAVTRPAPEIAPLVEVI